MKRILLLAFLGTLLASLSTAAWAGDPAADALDALIAGKTPVERAIPIRVDVVGYDVKSNPKAQAQLKAVSQAGGGQYSTAGTKNIGQIMKGLVSGQAPSSPAQGRRSYGERIIRHGSVK